MRMRALLSLLPRWVPIAAIALSVVDVGSLGAQGNQVRNGFWVMGGVAAAYNRTDCTNCPKEVGTSGVGTVLRLGGKVSRYVMIGGELYGFVDTKEDSRTEVGGVLFIGQWYPWTHLGFWFRAGGGISYADVRLNTSTNPEQVSKAGLGLSIGFGWDLRIARMVSITPFVTTYYNGLGAIDFSGGTLDNVLTTMWQAGVGVTFH